MRSDPNDIARVLTDSPDVLIEDTCPVCASKGEAGFISFNCSNPQCQNFDPRMQIRDQKWSLDIVLDDLLSGSHGGIAAEVYEKIKENGGVVVDWKDSYYKMGGNFVEYINIRATFENKQDADDTDRAMGTPDIASSSNLGFVTRKAEPATPADEVNYEIGEKDMEFVLQYHLS